MYDAIVVGARCAGSPAALMLARKGYRVLLVDSADFPSDKALSTHYLFPSGVAALHRFGLLDSLRRSTCPAIHDFLVDWGQNRFFTGIPSADGVSESYCPRRYVLDQILVEGALAAGVEFRPHTTVTDLIVQDGQVVGIRGRTKGAQNEFKEKARIVIGADGLFSQVAAKVGAEKYHEVPTKSAIFFSYWRGVPTRAGICMYLRPERLFAMGRTNDELTLIIDYVPIRDFSQFRADVEGNFLDDWRRLVPEVHEAMMQGERVAKWMGTGHQPNYFRRPMGPGWALVGDAALHHDSINPSGITYAFVNTEKTVEFIDDILAGRKRWGEALREFEQWRELRWLHHYRYVTGVAELQAPDAQQMELMEIMTRRPEVARSFMGFLSGRPEYYNFFDEENVRRILEASDDEPAVRNHPALSLESRVLGE